MYRNQKYSEKEATSDHFYRLKQGYKAGESVMEGMGEIVKHDLAATVFSIGERLGNVVDAVIYFGGLRAPQEYKERVAERTQNRRQELMFGAFTEFQQNRKRLDRIFHASLVSALGEARNVIRSKWE